MSIFNQLSSSRIIFDFRKLANRKIRTFFHHTLCFYYHELISYWFFLSLLCNRIISNSGFFIYKIQFYIRYNIYKQNFLSASFPKLASCILIIAKVIHMHFSLGPVELFPNNLRF